MGRFYSGDIHGKFWFGIQDSNDINNLVTSEFIIGYCWKECNCEILLNNNGNYIYIKNIKQLNILSF